MAKRHANEFMRTSTGRLAGNGMNHDNYSEQSYPGLPFGYKSNEGYWYSPKEKAEPEPCICYKLTKEELEEVIKKYGLEELSGEI